MSPAAVSVVATPRTCSAGRNNASATLSVTTWLIADYRTRTPHREKRYAEQTAKTNPNATEPTAKENTLNIEELQSRAYDHASGRGFWKDYEDAITDTWQSDPAIEAIKAAFIGQKLALIHSEVSEALEEVREGNYDATHKHGEKPEGLPSELADIVIRVADLCGALGIDLESTITEKLDYNSRSRDHKHGKKF